MHSCLLAADDHIVVENDHCAANPRTETAQYVAFPRTETAQYVAFPRTETAQYAAYPRESDQYSGSRRMYNSWRDPAAWYH